MTIDLAEFFRQTLRLGECERIRLEEELALVQHYLAIEQRRLGDKLSLCIDVDAACRMACLPPLVLQPLVENAIKHGIRLLDLGGRIELGASHVGGHLVLRVRNPVDSQASRDTSGLGQGLRHLQSRLLTQYGGSAFVELERTASLFTVQIALPWQT
jgi:LytS/YehU family sensor histidine kinase